MINKMKKITALFIALTVVLSLSAFGYAAGDAASIIDEAELNSWLDQYIADNGLSGDGKVVSVGFIYTKTGDEYYYNADEFMYSASLYKVPVSMMLAEKEAAGELTQESTVLGMTVAYLERTALVDSNNASGHYIADYVGENVSAYDTYNGKDADMARKYVTDLDDGYYTDDFYNYSYYTARFMTKLMNTLYKGGDAAYPYVISYLKQAQPNNYYNLALKGIYEVAQKYGAFEEKNGTKDNHTAAIIYTPNPIIVTVMTKNVSTYEKTIADIGAHLAEYAVSLDSKPVPTPTPAPTPTPTPTAAPVATIQPLQTNSTNTENEKDESSFPFYVLLIIPLLAAAIIAVKLLNKKDEHDGHENADEYEEYEEYEETIKEPVKAAKREKDIEIKEKKGTYIPKH